MQPKVKRLARNVASTFGLEISRKQPGIDERRQRVLAGNSIGLVVDAGANVGQYVSRVRGQGYDGPIVSFEPQPLAFDQLSTKCAQDPDWDCFQLGLGRTESSLQLNITDNSVSSSFLTPCLLYTSPSPRDS